MFSVMRIVPVATLTAGLFFADACGSTRIADGKQQAMGRSDAPPLFAGWPPVIVWAWQRPEDLGFIDPQRVGVSYSAPMSLCRGFRQAAGSTFSTRTPGRRRLWRKP
jgi:hypothetical protein